MTSDATFYFANLGADVSRCVRALKAGNETQYRDSLKRAHQTLEALHSTRRPEAYEEALLLLYGLKLARRFPNTLAAFEHSLDSIITPFASRLIPLRTS